MATAVGSPGAVGEQAIGDPGVDPARGGGRRGPQGPR